MIIRDMEQNSADWLKMRAGCCTASRLNDVLAKRRDGKESALRSNYKKQLVIERLTGNTTQHFVSDAMIHGTEMEPLARASYEIETERTVERIGLAMHPRIKWFSASTDGLIGEDGIFEAKCLNSVNHLDILIAGEIPEEYHWQMLAGMACAERAWCDFVSFDDRMPDNLQLFVKRFERNDALIAGMELEVSHFLSEVDEMFQQLKERDREFSAARG